MQININKQKTRDQILEKMQDLAMDLIDHTYAQIKYGKARVPGDLLRDPVTIQILTRYNRLIKFLEHLDADNERLKDLMQQASELRRAHAKLSALEIYHLMYLTIHHSVSAEKTGMLLGVFHQMVPLLLDKMKEEGIIDVYDF